VVFFAKDTFKGKLTARPSLVTYHSSLLNRLPAAFSQRSRRRGASIRFAHFLAMNVEQPAIAA
jgi:hypothetical protein